MNICKSILPYFLLYAISLLNISLTDSESRDLELRRDQPSKTGHDQKNSAGSNDPKNNPPKCARIRCLNSRTCENLVRKNRNCRLRYCNRGKCSSEKPQQQESTVRTNDRGSGNDEPEHNAKFRRFTKVSRRYTHWNSRPTETRKARFNKCAVKVLRSRSCRRTKRGLKRWIGSCINQLRSNCKLNSFPQRYKAEVREREVGHGAGRKNQLYIDRNHGTMVSLVYIPVEQGRKMEILRLDLSAPGTYEGKGIRKMMVEALEDRIRERWPHVEQIFVTVKKGETKRWGGYGFKVAADGPEMGKQEDENVLVKDIDRRS